MAISTLTLRVPVELEGERVDKALASLLAVSRSAAGLLLESGVTLDGETAKPSDRVRSNSVIVTPEPAKATGLQPEEVAFDVLFEDESVIVIDKPPGLVVHPGSGNRTGTLAAGLLYRYPDIDGVGHADRWGLVHRLDRDTSGVLVVARTSDAYVSLAAQLSARTIARVYLALVSGLFGIPTGTIEAPIGRDPLRPTRRAVVPLGKAATTHYSVLGEFEEDDATYVEVRLETGRTHQIRVHMTAIEHPVIGDRLYSSKPTKTKAPRVFLHAHRITFDHPVSGDRVEVESPLPDDLQLVLAGLADYDAISPTV